MSQSYGSQQELRKFFELVQLTISIHVPSRNPHAVEQLERADCICHQCLALVVFAVSTVQLIDPACKMVNESMYKQLFVSKMNYQK